MSLTAYRLDGTWLSLDKAPEVSFLVTEPNQANMEFACAVFDLLPPDFNEHRSTSAMHRVQRQAFLDVCVRECRGLGNGAGPPDLKQFFTEHPKALEELWDKAVALNAKSEAAQADVLGNSSAASAGN